MIGAMSVLRAPANKRTSSRKRVFLEAYAGCGNVRAAAAAVGMNHKLHYRALKSDPEYKAAFEALGDQVGQELEDLAVDRVRNGVKRQLFHNGKPIKTRDGHLVYETYYDTALHIALLKRFRPKLYREHIVQEHSGSINLVERLEQARARLLEIRRKEEEEKKSG
jgi:hypothetical protein